MTGISNLTRRVGVRCDALTHPGPVAALREHLARFKAAAGAASEEERRDWNWKNVAPGTYATLALRLIGLMEPETQLYFCRQFELADGRTLKPAWPLGWYLNSRRAVGL